jgi:transposase InsO family protein
MKRALLLIHGWIADAFATWLSTLRGPLARELASLLAANERLRLENELLRARLARMPGRDRPRYQPHERLAILAHHARWKLSFKETARRFVVSLMTLHNWRRAVEAGLRLVASREPMNKLPDLVREVAHAVKREIPRWGTRRVAAILAKLGLQASRTSVQRILRKPRPRKPGAAKQGRTTKARPIQARKSNDVWLIDFTEVRGFLGIATITIAAVIDSFGRKVLAIAAFPGGTGHRTVTDALLLMRRAITAAGTPRYLVCDHGRQFTARLFGSFLVRHQIRRRFGAVGRPQAVARIDRFWRSLKDEFAGELFALKPIAKINRELVAYAMWFNRHRVHEGLGGRTPSAVFAGRAPRRLLRPRKGERFVLCRRDLVGNRALPVFSLRRAA